MKSLLSAFALLVFIGILFIGCSDNSNPLLTSADPQNIILKNGNKIGSAGGGGNIIAGTSELGFFPVSLSGHGIKFQDGSVTGQYEMHFKPVETDKAITIHGIVRGIKFYGNKAMIWGDVTSEFLPELSDNWKQIIVITDNGEGNNSTEDRLSNPWFTTDDLWPGEFDTYWAITADEFLATIPIGFGLPGDYPLENGNYQVWSE